MVAVAPSVMAPASPLISWDVLVLVRIVDGRGGDRDDQLGAGAGVIGGRGGARGDALVVDRDEPEAVGEVLRCCRGCEPACRRRALAAVT